MTTNLYHRMDTVQFSRSGSALVPYTRGDLLVITDVKFDRQTKEPFYLTVFTNYFPTEFRGAQSEWAVKESDLSPVFERLNWRMAILDHRQMPHVFYAPSRAQVLNDVAKWMFRTQRRPFRVFGPHLADDFREPTSIYVHRHKQEVPA